MTTRRQMGLGLAALAGAAAAAPAFAQRDVSSPRQVATLADPLLIEGVAYWNGRTFLSSVLGRRIVELRDDGTLAPFVSDGLLPVFGMAIDWDGSRIFAATASLTQGGGSELVAISLESGTIQHRWAARSPAKLGDVVVGPNGAVYASDSAGGALWRLDLGSRDFAPIVPGGTMRSAQGMAVSPGQTVLLIADYDTGLHRYDLSNDELAPVVTPDGWPLRGIDGVCTWRGRVIATQNGHAPHQVLMLHMDEGWTTVGEVRVIAQGLGIEEPTLGTAIEGAMSSSRDRYLFVGRSQWGSLGADGRLRPGFGPTLIESLPLDGLA